MDYIMPASTFTMSQTLVYRVQFSVGVNMNPPHQSALCTLTS